MSKFKYLDQSTGIYNITNESLIHSKSGEKILDFYKSHFYLLDYYNSKYPTNSFSKFRARQKLISQLLFEDIKRKDENCKQKLIMMHGSGEELSYINRILLNISNRNKRNSVDNILLLTIRMLLRVRKILLYFWQKIANSL